MSTRLRDGLVTDITGKSSIRTVLAWHSPVKVSQPNDSPDTGCGSATARRLGPTGSTIGIRKTWPCGKAAASRSLGATSSFRSSPNTSGLCMESVVGLRAVPRQGVRHHCIRQVLADFDSGGGGRWVAVAIHVGCRQVRRPQLDGDQRAVVVDPDYLNRDHLEARRVDELVADRCGPRRCRRREQRNSLTGETAGHQPFHLSAERLTS